MSFATKRVEGEEVSSGSLYSTGDGGLVSVAENTSMSAKKKDWWPMLDKKSFLGRLSQIGLKKRVEESNWLPTPG